jgi:hypothetical protein
MDVVLVLVVDRFLEVMVVEDGIFASLVLLVWW